MSARTIYLSRLIGLFMLFVSVAMYMQKDAVIATVNALVQNPSQMFAMGLVCLAIGLALVLGHNVWKGGLLPIVVTLIGWITLLRGLLCLYLPSSMMADFMSKINLEQTLPLLALAPFVIGIYLTNAGFRIPTEKK